MKIDYDKYIMTRVPPHDVEAEQSVLGGILLTSALMDDISDVLSADDFYVPAHKILFSAFVSLYAQGTPIDILTVFDFLRSHNQLEEVGGSAYLVSLSNLFLSGANAPHWAQIVRDKAGRRSLLTTAIDIVVESFSCRLDLPTLFDESEKKIFAVTQRAGQKTSKTTADLIQDAFNEIALRCNNPGSTSGTTTGYIDLDRLTAGLRASDLIIIAARPSMGKTAFALNIAIRAALKHNITIAFFSLEMSKESLVERMLCAYGRVDLGRVRRGSLQDDDWERLAKAAEALCPLSIVIEDTAAMTPLALRARCRRIKAEKELGLVIVDYLQLMRSPRNESRELEISDISRNLKALAKELKVPVIALSQLNRKPEERSDKRPLLSDLRESGAIEQDADLIMFIHRQDVYAKTNAHKTGIAEIIIGKHRNGPTGTVEIAFLPQYTGFEDSAKHMGL
jgi:replicative DNA helicase